jgi:hypothetical protein
MTTLPDGLADYLAARDQQRLNAANRALSTLRPYERRLVCEAAVMGYVLGRQDGLVKARQGGSILDDADGFPHDSEILTSVVQHCISTDDLYPHIAEASEGRRRRVTRKRMWPLRSDAAW